MKRYLPFALIAAVFIVALGSAVILFRSLQEPLPRTVSPNAAVPGITPPSPSPSPTPAEVESPTPTAAPSAAEVESTTLAPAPTELESPTPAPPPAEVESSSPSPTPSARPATSPQFAAGTPGAKPPHIRGSARAPVALEEFGDFQCLPCSLLWPVLKQLESYYADRLSVTFRENPLSMHQHAMEAARAAEAASLQNHFWEMHDLLYQNRLAWITAIYPPKFFIEYASTLGLDVERFKKDMESEKVAARIAADTNRAASLGIDRTPVLFLNGQRVPRTARSVEDLHAAIDAALGISP